IECTSINTTNHHDWVVCAGILESLVNRFQERSILLTKIKNESSPNPISFLVETSHIITSIKIESKQYLLTTEQVLSSLIANETVESGNILDSFPEHDPGKREIGMLWMNQNILKIIKKMLNLKSSNKVSIECMSINTTNHYDWVVCAGILESLVNRFQECSILLTKIKNEFSPNPISFLVETSHIITSIKIESKQYLLTTE
ncbi:52 kDa repressor of the inhibitor of the protein kinase-like, partial [Aphis craccivora]